MPTGQSRGNVWEAGEEERKLKGNLCFSGAHSRANTEFLRGLEILPEIRNETAVVTAPPVLSTELKTIANSARQEKRDKGLKVWEDKRSLSHQRIKRFLACF